MSGYHDIADAERTVLDRKSDYLRSHMWTHTSSTPGCFWMWRRSFADVNERRATEHAEFCKRIGQPRERRAFPDEMLVDTDTAIRMTWCEIDPTGPAFHYED